MAKDASNRLFRFIRWAAEKVLDNWLSILFLGGATGAVTYLAKVSAFLQPYAPLSWAVAGLFAFLSLTGALALYGIYSSRRALARFEDRRGDGGTVDPRQDLFTKRTIKLGDFYHPFFRPTENVKFQDCDLFGPAIVFLSGTHLKGNNFEQCDFVITAENASSSTAMAFKDCTFLDCTFYRVMFLVDQAFYDKIKQSPGAEDLVPLAGGA